MAELIEPDYLEPPHIQLGFFWSRVPEVDAYRNVLRRLLSHGYRMHPVITAVRSRSGALPRFNQLAAHRLSETDICLRDDLEATDLFRTTEWLPVLVRLVAEDEANVDIDLNYALIHEESFAAGEPHAIEVVASGAELNLADNSPLKELDGTTARNAYRTERWRGCMFRYLCDELHPDYAGCFWEYDLQPPRSLVASSNPRSFSDLYLSDEILQQTPGIEGNAAFSQWSVTRFAAGAFFAPRAQLDDQRLEPGITVIRHLITQKYLR